MGRAVRRVVPEGCLSRGVRRVVSAGRVGGPVRRPAPGERLSRAVRAEWTKLWSTPGPLWLLLATVVVTVGVGVAVTGAAACPHAGCDVDVGRVAFSGVYLGQASVAVLGVLSVGGEYSTGLIRVTVAAVPSRPTILGAKAVVLAAVVGVVGSISLLICLPLAGAVLRDDGYSALALRGAPVLRACFGSAVYLVLIVVLSLGAAAVLRDSAVSIGAVLGVLYLPPVLSPLVADPHLHRLLDQVAPMTAGLAVQATTGLRGMPIGPWPGLGVLAAWSVVALLTGAVLFRSRDT